MGENPFLGHVIMAPSVTTGDGGAVLTRQDILTKDSQNNNRIPLRARASE